MRKALGIGVLVSLMLLIAIGETQAYNPRTSNLKARMLQDYGVLAPKAMDPGPEMAKQGSMPISLGAYAADGGSPGEIIGRSWRDDQNHFSPAHFLGWRNTPQIHFVYNAQACAGNDNPDACARWIHYNMFNPQISPGGVYIN